MRIGMGAATCSAPVDTLYPAGCPSGYTLQPVYMLASTGEPTSPSTPGATQQFDDLGCSIFECLNPSFQSASANAASTKQASCSTPAYIVAGIGLIGLLLLPGGWKLLSFVTLPIAFSISIECSGGL
jgi:hypothetical protein